MKQVLFIHGGTSYNSYESFLDDLKNSPIYYERLKPRGKWESWIAENMDDTDILIPSFPNDSNAVYDEWKIYFEKLLPLLNEDAQIVGHSLGAMFLAIYLHEQPLKRKVHRIVLISGGYDDDSNEELGSFRVRSAKGIERSADEVHLFHSKGDPLVPFTELAKFQSDLPDAISHIFEGRGHFIDETFPELLKLLEQK